MHLLLKDREDGQVVEGHPGNIRVVADGEGGSSRGGLIVGMECAALPIGVVVKAVGRVRRVPVVGMRASIGPVGGELPVEGEGSERAVLGDLDGERSAGGQLERVTIVRRKLVATAVVLHPPVALRQVVQRGDHGIRVGVVDARFGAVLVEVVSEYICA